jgi:hypothetical protein
MDHGEDGLTMERGISLGHETLSKTAVLHRSMTLLCLTFPSQPYRRPRYHARRMHNDRILSRWPFLCLSPLRPVQ